MPFEHHILRPGAATLHPTIEASTASETDADATADAEIRVSSGSFPILRTPVTCFAETVDLHVTPAEPAAGGSAQLPRAPVLTYWLIAVVLEVVLGAAIFATRADAAIERGLARAGLDFGSDLVTAARVVVVYPAALLAVMLALAQVAAPDLAVWVWWPRFAAAGP